MAKTAHGRWGKANPVVRFLFVSAVLFIAFPLSTQAQNDLLKRPAGMSEKAPRSLLLDIAKAGDRLVAVGGRGHILCSDDKGQSWRQAKVPTSVTLTAVYFPTPDKGWAVGHDGVVLHSTDAGDTWTIQLDGFGQMALNLAHAEKLVAAAEARLAGAAEDEKADLEAKLEDLRYQHESIEIAHKEGTCCDPLLDVWFKNEEEGFVTGAYGLFFRTTDGGQSWASWYDRVDNPDSLHLNAFAGTDEVLYIAGEAGMLFRSLDDGMTWESLESPYAGSYFGIVASPDNTSAIAFGVGAKMVHSADRGLSWQLVQTPAGAALSGGIATKGGETMIVAYSGVILAGSGDPGTFVPKKIGAGWNALADTGDGHIVLVGLRGAMRAPFN